jgi:outer membrane protein assembly factor BamE (lipoprotein component of BamABCDE complex)
MTSNRLRRHARLLAAMACVSAASPALMSCAPLVDPVIEQRGYVLNEKDLKQIKPKQTTRDQVKEIMGSPSTVSTIDGEAWYYINSKMESYLFYPPEEIDRTVVAVYFEKQDTVQQVAYYGLADGQVVDLVTRSTPTRGKELTVLGQLFSNLGRFNNKKDDKKTNSGPTPGRSSGGGY